MFDCRDQADHARTNDDAAASEFRRLTESTLRDGKLRRLTLIHAPTGYGKTTVAAQWAEELAVDGVPQVGVVSMPALGRRWWASTGAGAWTAAHPRPRQIRTSAVSSLDDAAVSFQSITQWADAGHLPALLRLADRVWRDRALGDVYAYMLLAEGKVDIVVGTHREPAVRTTGEAPQVQGNLARMRDAGVQHVVLETSSHGIHLQRVAGTRYAAALFTMLGEYRSRQLGGRTASERAIELLRAVPASTGAVPAGRRTRR